MGAAAQVIAGIEREKRDLERDLERRNMENRNTLQMMASLQDSHQQQVPTARRPDGCPPSASTSRVSVRGDRQTKVLCLW
jgi:uridine kinase